MTIVTKSVIDKDGVVINVVRALDTDQVDRATGLALSDLVANKGDRIVDGVVVPAVTPPRDRTFNTAQARIEELEAALRVLKTKDVLTDAEVEAEKQTTTIRKDSIMAPEDEINPKPLEELGGKD